MTDKQMRNEIVHIVAFSAFWGFLVGVAVCGVLKWLTQ